LPFPLNDKNELQDKPMTFEPASGFPLHRPRRLRGHARIREMVSETRLSVHNLIYPLFVYHGKNLRREIASMPGQYQLSLDRVGEVMAEAAELGIPAILLFGIPEHKDAVGSAAVRDDGIVQEAIRIANRVAPELLVITDLCFCEYTDHGHCGPLKEIRGRLDVDNDATLPLLAQQAVSHANAGADVIAPSGMMDGMVQAIREGLDDTGFSHIPILSYAAKFASGYYGPFRDAAESAPSFGDRRTYQMDPGNAQEALREVALDLAEGADMIMVKPALAYLDIVHRVKAEFGIPVAAYNVSGEYAMVKAAAANGWIDERRIVMETLTGIKRAGADMILTYHALDAARWLRQG
jgi:porphobilinogen synthase